MVKNVSLSGEIRRDIDDKFLHTSIQEEAENLSDCLKDDTCGDNLFTEVAREQHIDKFH